MHCILYLMLSNLRYAAFTAKETKPKPNRYDWPGRKIETIIDVDNEDEVDGIDPRSSTAAAGATVGASSSSKSRRLSQLTPPEDNDSDSQDENNEGRLSEDPMVNMFWADRLLPDSSAFVNHLPFFPGRYVEFISFEHLPSMLSASSIVVRIRE